MTIMLNLTKLGPWEAGSIIIDIVQVLYLQGNIDIISYENSKGVNPYSEV